MGNEKLFTGKNASLALIPFLICLFLINGPWIGAPAVSRASGGAVVPDLIFSYSPDQLAPMFQALGEAGKNAYLGMNFLDFFFAFFYGLLFFVTLGWLAVRLYPSIRWLRFIGVLGCIGALADEIENVIFRLIASGLQDGTGPLAATASVAGPIKFTGTYLCLGLVFIGLIAIGIVAFRKKIVK
jgi:hypothetical protein